MTRKRFDSRDAEYGKPAELVVHSWLTQSGYEARRHANGSFGEDVSYVGKDGRQWLVEVERMRDRRWPHGRDEFPQGLRPIHILAARKTGHNVFHAQVSADMAGALFSFPCDHANAPIKQCNNVEMQSEPMRLVEYERMLHVMLDQPIRQTLEEANRERVLRLVHSVRCDRSRKAAERALWGGIGEPFREPFGMSLGEWIACCDRMKKYVGSKDPARQYAPKQTFMPFLISSW